MPENSLIHACVYFLVSHRIKKLVSGFDVENTVVFIHKTDCLTRSLNASGRTDCVFNHCRIAGGPPKICFQNIEKTLNTFKSDRASDTVCEWLSEWVRQSVSEVVWVSECEWLGVVAMNILSYLFGSRPSHTQVPLPDYKLLTSVTNFTKREIQRMYARYCVVCRSDGLMSIKQFAKLPEVATYPMMLLSFELESNDSYGLLNFSQIVLLLSNFSVKGMWLASYSSLWNSFANSITHLGRDGEKIEYVNQIIKETNAKSDTTVTKEQYVSFMGQLAHGSLPSFIFGDVLNKALVDLPTDRTSRHSSNDDLLHLVSEYDLKTRMSSVF